MLPSYLFVKSCDLSSIQNVTSSESRNLITLSRTLPGHRWEMRMQIDIAPFNVRPARAFLYSLQRDNATTLYTDPDWETGITGREASTAATAGATQFEVSDTTDIQEGMFLNFAGHSKMYMVTGISGFNVEIFPELHADVALDENVILDSPSVEAELPPELKRSAQFSSSLERDLSNFALRLWEVRR